MVTNKKTFNCNWSIWIKYCQTELMSINFEIFDLIIIGGALNLSSLFVYVKIFLNVQHFLTFARVVFKHYHIENFFRQKTGLCSVHHSSVLLYVSQMYNIKHSLEGGKGKSWLGKIIHNKVIHALARYDCVRGKNCT